MAHGHPGFFFPFWHPQLVSFVLRLDASWPQGGCCGFRSRHITVLLKFVEETFRQSPQKASPHVLLAGGWEVRIYSFVSRRRGHWIHVALLPASDMAVEGRKAPVCEQLRISASVYVCMWTWALGPWTANECRGRPYWPWVFGVTLLFKERVLFPPAQRVCFLGVEAKSSTFDSLPLNLLISGTVLGTWEAHNKCLSLTIE